MHLILVAEDNPGDLFLLEESLREHKILCEVVAVRNGEEFLNYAKEVCDDKPMRKPDLIILDWTLPKASGAVLVREVRESPRCADAPILVLTASLSPKDRAEAMVAGVTEFITKPNHLDEYIEGVGKAVCRLLGGDTKKAANN